ncbi:MAG: hypothetical protein ACREL5_03910 [Gemmatimonadales bacterium]
MAADSLNHDAWFEQHTTGAPEHLARRTADFFRAASGDLVSRLAAAGDMALVTATGGGAARGAALDLLAADALITLALLASAEADPTALAAAARALRTRAVG